MRHIFGSDLYRVNTADLCFSFPGLLLLAGVASACSVTEVSFFIKPDPPKRVQGFGGPSEPENFTILRVSVGSLIAGALSHLGFWSRVVVQPPNSPPHPTPTPRLNDSIDQVVAHLAWLGTVASHTHTHTHTYTHTHTHTHTHQLG